MSDERSITARQLYEQYHLMQQTRQEYRRSIGTEAEAAFHEELHEVVFDLYEQLRPIIQSANATEEQWEERDLWPTGRQLAAASVCPACEAVELPEYAEKGALCPSCERAVMESGEAPAVDEDGNPVYHWATGLQTLDGMRHRTREVNLNYEDALGTYEGTRVERILLDPQQLIVSADVLAECMEQLGLLADVDDETQTTDLDQSDLDAFRERLEELKDEAWDDHDDVDTGEAEA